MGNRGHVLVYLLDIPRGISRYPSGVTQRISFGYPISRWVETLNQKLTKYGENPGHFGNVIATFLLVVEPNPKNL